MAKYLQLQVPQGCNEDWNAMLPDKNGKFCLSCQKQVIDFTKMSDRELVAFFKKRKQNTCGRFSAEQLNRDIHIPSKRILWLRYFFQFTLPAFLLSLKASGQTIGKSKPSIEIAPVTKGEIMPVIIKEALVNPMSQIQGTIRDENGEPLSGSSISIKGTNIATVADSAGNFNVTEVQLPVTLVVNCIGFESVEKVINSNKEAVGIELSMAMTHTSGLVEIVAGNVAPKQKQRKKELCVKLVVPSLSAYPNPLPANHPLHLKWQGLEAGRYTIEIYSIGGVLTHSQSISIERWMTEHILACNLVAGSYVVRLIDEKSGKGLNQQVLVQE